MYRVNYRFTNGIRLGIFLYHLCTRVMLYTTVYYFIAAFVNRASYLFQNHQLQYNLPLEGGTKRKYYNMYNIIHVKIH